MAVRVLKPPDIAPLHSLYRAVTEGMPHGFPAPLADFSAPLFRPAPHHRCGSTFVVESSGELRGFIQASIFRPIADRWSFAKPGDGLLFGPFYRANDDPAGEALLAAGIQSLRSLGAERVYAFDPIESAGAPYYNAGWCGLSELLPHIVTLYASNGFRLRYREFCLFRDHLSQLPERRPIPSPLTLSYEVRDAHRLSVKLYERGVFAGACHYSRMYPRRTGNLDGQYRGYIDGLSIPDQYQGRGLGRLLLVEGLLRLSQLGCTSVSLTTASDNFKAQNLYFSLGFRLVDSSVTLTRTL